MLSNCLPFVQDVKRLHLDRGRLVHNRRILCDFRSINLQRRVGKSPRLAACLHLPGGTYARCYVYRHARQDVIDLLLEVETLLSIAKKEQPHV